MAVPGALQAWLTLIVKVVASVSGVGLSLAPFREVETFKRRGTTGSKHPLPYAMMVLNGGAWSVYAGLVWDPFPMLATNVLQCTFGCYYLYIFMKFSTRARVNTAWLASAVALVGLFVVFECAISLEDPVSRIGQMGVFLVVSMFASPLVVAREVWRTRNSAALSPRFSTLALVCSLSWGLYGGILNDAFIYGPNILGTFFSLLQLYLIARFPDGSAKKPTPTELELQRSALEAAELLTGSSPRSAV